MNVIFLDCDGVLNITTGKDSTYKKQYNHFDFKLIENLNNLLNSLEHLKIIITSSWRDDLNDLINELEKSGFKYRKRIVGKTKNLNNRGLEIKSFLDENKVKKYAIIDDEINEIKEYFKENIFKINPETGIIKKDIENIEKIFLEKFKCINCNSNKLATWIYMPGYSNSIKYEEDCHCDDCVPRGCSCNNEILNGELSKEEIQKQIKELLKQNIKIKNYGSKIHEVGKELEIITDKNLIKILFFNLTTEQLLHFEIIFLDEKGREYPCCEYFYEESGLEREIS